MDTTLRLNQAPLPDYKTFDNLCREGLSAYYPIIGGTSDPLGWLYRKHYPPSYFTFGRTRAVMTLREAMCSGSKRVLEVASGGGGLAASLAQNGCEVVANDLREEHLSASLQKHYLSGSTVKVAGGNIFDLSPRDLGNFDLVVAAELIEHVAHPETLLAHLKTFLRPGGRILVTTPNGSYLRNKLPNYSDIEDPSALEQSQFQPDADGHLFLLTPDELRALANSAGLAVQHLSVWGTPFLSGHCGLRLLSSRLISRVAYLVEKFIQQLSLRERLCFSIFALLKLP
jgi:2-polyprenyl-3-methyl-5-hydroxy-6-metoxy-1,4-benzoquinol methylase